jgi:formylmethanofuran dehydrogenase subunit C
LGKYVGPIVENGFGNVIGNVNGNVTRYLGLHIDGGAVIVKPNSEIQ